LIYNDELLQIYYDAVKKGNPNAIVAFNNGVFDVITREGGVVTVDIFLSSEAARASTRRRLVRCGTWGF